MHPLSQAGISPTRLMTHRHKGPHLQLSHPDANTPISIRRDPSGSGNLASGDAKVLKRVSENLLSTCAESGLTADSESNSSGNQTARSDALSSIRDQAVCFFRDRLRAIHLLVRSHQQPSP